jgi:GNAT superfamily N-acetyltransferase
MVTCPQCGSEVQPDWDWCHACGWDPDAALPAVAPVAHPEVLKSELVPRAGDAVGPAGAAGAGPGQGPTRVRSAPRSAGAGYVPKPDRTVPVVVGGCVVALLVVVLAVVLVGRGEEPVPVATADLSDVSITTTTRLPLTPWVLPEGGLKVDLPTPLEPAVAPDVPAPFVAAVAYGGAADGREYLVASLAVHPAYKWEDLGRALIDAVDGLGAQHGFTVVSRNAGAFKAMSSSRFTFVAARGPTETEAEFAARTEAPATGEGIALVTGNHLYVVLVKGQSLPQAHFTPVLESIVVV